MSALQYSPLLIDTSYDLENHKPEILRRINGLPNGGVLFTLHPFRLLADLRIELSEDCKRQILAKTPELADLPDAPYTAMKAAGATKAGLRVRVLGLFQ